MKTFSKILTLLETRDRFRAVGVLGLFLLMSFLEVLGIASILPFITILSNPDAVQSNTWLKWAYDFFGFTQTNHFLFFCGFGVLGVLIANNGVKALTRWVTIYETQRWGERLSCRLLEIYLGQPYRFFLYKNSAEISKNILAEVHIATHNIVLCTLEGISKTVVSFAILALLMLVDPLLALSAIGGMGVLYGSVFVFLRKTLLKHAARRTQAHSAKFKIVNEALQGIKNIKLGGYETVYQRHFSLPANQYALSNARSGVIREIPHFAVEVIAFGGILLITLYLLAQNAGELSHVLPTIVLYSFAGYRLMPGMQGIYYALSKIRFHAPVLDSLVRELGRVSTMQPVTQAPLNPMIFQKNLEMQGVEFSYESNSKKILHDVNFQIYPHEVIGIIGKTGAGKTTLVDLLLGLLDPSEGQILVDGVPLTPENQRAWQKNLSYVSQHIYLCDDTVRANIAFGIPPIQIEEEQMRSVARMADLADFIETELPQGYDTIIGENGIRLSGGQRQRLGLARALYLNRPVLVLDEATSALDPETERNVMEAIYALGHNRTILMISHKPELLERCDYILRVQDGQVEKIYPETLREKGMRHETFSRKRDGE